MFEKFGAPEWIALLTVAATLIVASASGVWAVCVRSAENNRAQWKRIEELMQIIHHGADTGLWAQKLAVEELLTIPGHRHRIMRVLSEAAAHFRAAGPNGGLFADHIEAATAQCLHRTPPGMPQPTTSSGLKK